MRRLFLILLLALSGPVLAQPFADAPPPPPLPADVEDFEPEVVIRQDGTDTVTEYRVRGKLYMIKVTPAYGPPYYLVDREGTGQMIRHDGSGHPIIPMWVIKSW